MYYVSTKFIEFFFIMIKFKTTKNKSTLYNKQTILKYLVVASMSNIDYQFLKKL